MAGMFASVRRYGIYAIVCAALGVFLVSLYWELGRSTIDDIPPNNPFSDPVVEKPPTSTTRQPCIGPRERYVQENRDDQIWAESLDLPFPESVGGSHLELGLPYTFNTPSTRYGAYGYGEDSESYGRARVQWNAINWGKLQNECFTANKARFRETETIFTNRRSSLRSPSDAVKQLKARKGSTGRTAIVLRSWEGYDYTTTSMYHIRSLIVEAGLQLNADNAIFLLVDVKDQNNTRSIFHDSRAYDQALEELVPAELREIAVLFDLELLESWYPMISEHTAFFQVYQPLQLFAQLFPGFDHYWQLEMDIKFTGDSGVWLEAMSQFAKNQPRKQSVERSSYFYMPQVHGSYEQFTSEVNSSLEGGGIWGPVQIPDVPSPVGTQPPTSDPHMDNFEWGIDEHADLILTNALADVTNAKFWPFKGWVHKFKHGGDTPRWYSPVAMGRYSWNLLNAMHHAQAYHGLALSSEAMAVSFTLYHGMKVVFPPHPWYHRPQADREVSVEELAQLFNGGSPEENAETNSGLAFGRAMYNPQGVYKLFNGGTWWWVPGYPGTIFKQWMKNDSTNLPSMLKEHNGELWAPFMALHPVKWSENA